MSYALTPGRLRTAIPAGFGLCAALFLAGAGALAFLERIEPEDAGGGPAKVDRAPLRGELRPLRLRRGTFDYACSECHRTFQSPPGRRALVAEHTDLRFDHGSNDYCLNCHHPTNRNAYVAHDGSEIRADRPAELCRKCHGPTHRDWEQGAHGRRQGHCDASRGERQRLLCIQCHDPHAPRFPKLAPMAGPPVGRGPAPGSEGETQSGEEAHG